MPNHNENDDPASVEVTAASVILKALANEHRLLALLALAQRPLAVNELNRQLPIAQSALSQHLARLREAGLVVCERDGSRVRYALADARARRLVEAVRAEYGRPAITDDLAPLLGAAHYTDPTAAAEEAPRL